MSKFGMGNCTGLLEQMYDDDMLNKGGRKN